MNFSKIFKDFQRFSKNAYNSWNTFQNKVMLLFWDVALAKILKIFMSHISHWRLEQISIWGPCWCISTRNPCNRAKMMIIHFAIDRKQIYSIKIRLKWLLQWVGCWIFTADWCGIFYNTNLLHFRDGHIARTENSVKAQLERQKIFWGAFFAKTNIADLKRSRRELCQTYLEISRLQF